jgi:hypothetical protein
MLYSSQTVHSFRQSFVLLSKGAPAGENSSTLIYGVELVALYVGWHFSCIAQTIKGNSFGGDRESAVDGGPTSNENYRTIGLQFLQSQADRKPPNAEAHHSDGACTQSSPA